MGCFHAYVHLGSHYSDQYVEYFQRTRRLPHHPPPGRYPLVTPDLFAGFWTPCNEVASFTHHHVGEFCSFSLLYSFHCMTILFFTHFTLKRHLGCFKLELFWIKLYKYSYMYILVDISPNFYRGYIQERIYHRICLSAYITKCFIKVIIPVHTFSNKCMRVTVVPYPWYYFIVSFTNL